MVIIGDLRYSIDVLIKSTIKDEYGAQTIVWNNYLTNIRAGVKWGKGVKETNEHEIFTKQFVIFTTLYRDINPEMRILWRGKKYLVNIVEDINFREGLNIHCELINE